MLAKEIETGKVGESDLYSDGGIRTYGFINLREMLRYKDKSMMTVIGRGR